MSSALPESVCGFADAEEKLINTMAINAENIFLKLELRRIFMNLVYLRSLQLE